MVCNYTFCFLYILRDKYSGIDLEINNTKKTGKFTKRWKLNNTLLNNKWVKEEITREIQK